MKQLDGKHSGTFRICLLCVLKGNGCQPSVTLCHPASRYVPQPYIAYMLEQ